MTFEENIQKWVLLDNQIKILNERVKGLREQKNLTSESKIENEYKNLSAGAKEIDYSIQKLL